MNSPPPDSLGATLDEVAEALFFGRRISAQRRLAFSRRIARHQGRPGAYAGMFAPTAADLRGFRLFTGEVVRSRAGIGHLIGEESCRLLALLRVEDDVVQSALVRAIDGMRARLAEAETRGQCTAVYCCGTCAAGYWRNLALGMFPRAHERLRTGLARLRKQREPDGTWRGFPFYYTCLSLTEIGPNLAGAELRHSAKRWQAILPRLEQEADRDPLARRRAELGWRLLGSLW